MRIRLTLAAALVVALVAALAGCTPNKPGLATDWLAGQQGVADVQVMADHSDAFVSTGVIRGELTPDLDDAGLARLVDSVQSYLVDHGEVGVRLGRNGLYFAVAEDDAAVARSIDLWNEASQVDGIANGVVTTYDQSDSIVHVRALREDAVGVYRALAPADATLEVEALRTAGDIAYDLEQDDFFGSDIENRLSVAIHRDAACTPTRTQVALAEGFVGRDDIDGAQLRLCDGFDAYFALAASLARVVPDLRAELEAAGLDQFPVWARQAFDAYPDGRSVAVTPGDPGALAVIDVFETAGAPPAYFELTPERVLTVTEYGTPVADLLTLVSGSAVAASLPLVGLEGTDVAISGTLADLPTTLAQAVALAGTSGQYGGIELSPTTGSVTLESPVATDPDVVTAAADLRASGAWQGRVFTVIYLSTQLSITDGVATVGDPNYTDGHVVQGFVDAWNAAG